MKKISKILVPVDFSSCSRAALNRALSLAAQLDATVDVLHVAELPPFDEDLKVVGKHGSQTLREHAVEAGQSALDVFLAGDGAEKRSTLSAILDAGRPQDCILKHAERGDYDLIVMGTHGRTGRARSLAGSVAESVVRTSPRPVLTVREAT